MNNWLRPGFTQDDVLKPGSDTLIDAVVAYGTPEAIARRLNEHCRPCWRARTRTRCCRR
jgi:hypothetical protein